MNPIANGNEAPKDPFQFDSNSNSKTDSNLIPNSNLVPLQPMDPEAFRQWGKAMVDKVADYWETLRSRRPQPDLEPGSIRAQLPKDPPAQAEPWEAIFADVDKIILPGTTHWQHPHFFAYYPTATSYPGIMGDILSGGLSCIGFTWNSSPACTELEMVMMDWLAKALDLPEHFLFESPGNGGGLIQCTASDSSLVALLAARSRTLNGIQRRNSMADSREIMEHLVVYSSEEAHSSVERAALLAAVHIRKLPTDDVFALRGETLAKAVAEDRKKGFIPFAVVATLGTTPSCAFDKLTEIGPVCQDNNLWLHIDAAYAGSAFICPEYRHWMKGVEYADSFNFNAHKMMLVNFDCSPMWFKNTHEVEQAFHVDPLYLKHDKQGLVPDYRHWQVPLGRRFRSLKVWFTLRAFGIEGIQKYIRSRCELAQKFAELVNQDSRFEIMAPVILGLVTFRLKGSDSINEKLLKGLNDDGRIHMVPSHLKGKYILRFAVCSSLTTENDVEFAWHVIHEVIQKHDLQIQIENGAEIPPPKEDPDNVFAA